MSELSRRRHDSTVRGDIEPVGSCWQSMKREWLRRAPRANCILGVDSHSVRMMPVRASQLWSDGMARILIADDDPLLRALLQHKLAAANHQVVAAEHGGEVLDRIGDHAPDLIVLDAMMPVMDGFEVLRRLKDEQSTRDIPVIMLTALKREQDVVGGLQLGAADYLAKPFIPDELVERIRRVLGASNTERRDDRSRHRG